MTPAPKGVGVSITSRQRRLKINTKLLSQLAGSAVEFCGSHTFELSIAVVNDAAMAELNERHHDTPGPTDILTFDYGNGQGELIISADHVVAQARRYRSTVARELVLYVVHGILHLHGQNDVTGRARQRMRASERRVLRHLEKTWDLRDVVR